MTVNPQLSEFQGDLVETALYIQIKLNITKQ